MTIPPTYRLLPRLFALAVICSFIGANTSPVNNNTSPLTNGDGEVLGETGPQNRGARHPRVLSAEDAQAYRAAFTAQAKGDMAAADQALGSLHDQQLMGHVLADRYLRHTPALAQLTAWLRLYGDLPEAPQLYEKAVKLQPRGLDLAKPVAGNAWGGEHDSTSASYGFRVDDGTDLAPDDQRLIQRIDQRLRRGDPGGAEDLLHAELMQATLPSDVVADAEGSIAAGYFFAGASQRAREVAVDAGDESPLALWINGLASWKNEDYESAASAFERLAVEPQLEASDRTAAAFWAYRADAKLGRKRDAHVWLQKASLEPHSFYGMLASSLTGRGHLWSWTVPRLDARALALLTKSPAGSRALALIEAGQRNLAESELRHLHPQGRRDLQEAMLAVAETNHLPVLEVQLGGLAAEEKGRRYDAAFYPVPPWQPAEGFKVDRALLYALMRRESYFNPAAVSGRGACGLMQLMPETAHLVSQGRVAGGDCSGRMLDPSYNLALGQSYVRRLAAQPSIGTNLLFLLAAYNGGPGNLARWTEDGSSDPLLFLESLPLRETRDYVQQVLMHYWTYRARLDETGGSMAQLARGEWPHYVLRDETVTAPRLRDASLPDAVSGIESVRFASRDQ